MLRHSRHRRFAEALNGPVRSVRHWSELSSDPNAPTVLAHRARMLQAAWRPPIADRIAFIEERCRNRKVLDVGCVAHDVERMSAPSWLHGRIAAVAGHCVGVDVLDAGVQEMRRRGYDVVLHDLRTGLGPIAGEGPFDVIVAGELIEHVEALDMLFTVAAQALGDTGQLIITTPNPYAPDRVRAGQLGIVWENVDHIVYAFPSGIAELCERHGLRLAEAAVTADHRPGGTLVPRLRTLLRLLRGQGWVAAGYATNGALRHVRADPPLLRRCRRWFLGRRPFVGETFVYIVGRAPG